jgi:UDP-N-acetylmuramate--alanine ligase
VGGKAWSIRDIQLNIGGWHNIENTLAAIAVSKKLRLTDDQILQAVNRFRGVKRRFEYHAVGKGPVYIDDYAHHPQELKALIGSARALFPDRKTLVIFQPHLFSRTRDFADGFAASLDMADEVVLLPLYPARELPLEGVSSATILDKMEIRQKQILDKAQVLDYIRKIKDKDKLLLISAGAGDIDTLVKPLTEIVNAA